ncbi:hypothetical protein [Thermochromatium tepidum]|uniref:DUF3106 domain-containing protein n=1 Tax=Thermochromatium tepidum ATCC 43061 TaxID=316276 RepID=A0A6I6EE28_THETI|nr:hypothetical protein [Thermochromatium tepidum]QGU32400.1 hypothetical protein E6P07_04990 [Thermochromatium tepidum ATCC 43061]
MKLIQAASAIALIATTTTSLAWYAAPYPATAPSADQFKALIEQQQAMFEQHDKAMREAFEAQRQFFEQQRAWFDRNRPAWLASPEPPAAPEFGEYPKASELPKRPELGQFPAMPDSLEAHRREMDAYREQVKQRIEEHREAMKHWIEERRAEHPSRHLAKLPQHQAQAPVESSTQTH